MGFLRSVFNEDFWRDVILGILAGIGVMTGWYVGHRLAIGDERRTQSVHYAVDAFKKMSGFINRDSDRCIFGADREKKWRDDIEGAFEEIQLFGNELEVRLAKKAAWEFQEKGRVALDPLMKELRRHLRSELGQENLPSEIDTIWSFRYCLPGEVVRESEQKKPQGRAN